MVTSAPFAQIDATTTCVAWTLPKTRGRGQRAGINLLQRFWTIYSSILTQRARKRRQGRRARARAIPRVLMKLKYITDIAQLGGSPPHGIWRLYSLPSVLYSTVLRTVQYPHVRRTNESIVAGWVQWLGWVA